jgi:hypothetical protein
MMLGEKALMEFNLMGDERILWRINTPEWY